MKITKLKNGYRIKCSEGDFALLDTLLNLTPVEVLKRKLEGGAKGAYTRRTNGGDLFRVDVDNSM